MAKQPGRLFMVFSGLLVAVGAVVGMNGGHRHPTISQNMGHFGTDTFFVNFAKMMVVDESGWMQLHTKIMISPLLTCLGAFVIVLLAHRVGESQWTPLGFVMLAMGAVMWVVLYIYDGFVSPVTAHALLDAQGNPSLAAAISQTFGSGQWFTIRLSLFAWMLTAMGTAALSVGLMALAKSFSRGALRIFARVLGVVGLALGAYSLIAWIAGAYSPGPMADETWWLPADITTLVWYVLLGFFILLRAFNMHETKRDVAASSDPVGVDADPIEASQTV